MFALGIRYLNGWAMAASDGAKKESAEWPPHPDRIFMAMAAAYFEGERDPSARAALEWLEQLPPPQLAASPAEFREVVTHYVPVNDASMPSIDAERIAAISDAQARAGMTLLPEQRSRQPRQFPVAIPHDDTVHLIWPDASSTDEQREALATLCTQVTCIGHSASLVQMWVADAPPEANWQPAANQLVGTPLRVPTASRLQMLEIDFNESARVSWQQLERAIATTKGKEQKAHKADRKARFGDQPPAMNRPRDGLWLKYEPVVENVIERVVEQGQFATRLLVFRQTGGRRLGLESTLLLTETLHKFLLHACPQQPPPEWISGHRGSSHSRDTHLAMLPLPHVGHTHADGHLLGIALAIPKSVDAVEIGRQLAPLFGVDDNGEPARFRLYSGARLDAEFRFELEPNQAQALDADIWTAGKEGATTWATVTPIVLDRHVRRSSAPWEIAEDAVRQACAWADLPQPQHVLLGPFSHFIGSLPAGGQRGSYPSMLRKDGARRQQVHAVLTFDEPVRGPMLLGAGRYRGYGLCRPWPARRSTQR